VTDTPSHPGLKCPSCSTILAFIEYGSKIGKNNKPAKWPIYEKCTNPECKTGKKNLGVKDAIEPASPPKFVPLPEPVKGPPTSMFQWSQSRVWSPVYYAFFGAFKLCSEKHGTSTSITRVFMHLEDAKFLAEQFPEDTTWVDNTLVLSPPEGVSKPEILVEARDIKTTKKFRYFLVEVREPAEVKTPEEEVSDVEPSGDS